MKQIILAFDSFKGTLMADEVCSIVEKAIHNRVPETIVKSIPLSDGGEGMVASYLNICGGEYCLETFSGPYGEAVEAGLGILPNGTCVLEMAACAGLPLVGEHKDIMTATTYGVGEMLLYAAGHGFKKVLLGLGGSATNDCGIGMAAALGYRFYDESGNLVKPVAINMMRIRHIECPEQLPDIEVAAACDVDNPLYGPTGAAFTFGMQKGGDTEMLEKLDMGLRNMAEVIKNDLDVCVSDVDGAGAAGGLGAGVIAFLGGTLKPGIEILLDAADFDNLLNKTDLVFTGEGRMDWQSAFGKVPVGVSKRAKAKKIPCIALCGAIGSGAEKVYEHGITAIFSSVREASDFELIKKTCKDDIRFLADSVVRLLQL